MTALLEVRDLEVRHGRIPKVSGVSFSLRSGEVLTVLGRNGAGKSSLLLGIAGGLRVSSGDFLLDGVSVSRRSAHERVRAGIALVPEGRRIFPALTVRENLRLGGFWLSKNRFEKSAGDVFSLFPLLANRREMLAGKLSGGQQQMLAVARALVGGPRLLLLDEPSLGLAPKVVDEVYERLEALRERGLAMILVEQHARRALDFADAALVLHLGEPVFSGAPAELETTDRLAHVYLGKSG